MVSFSHFFRLFQRHCHCHFHLQFPWTGLKCWGKASLAFSFIFSSKDGSSSVWILSDYSPKSQALLKKRKEKKRKNLNAFTGIYPNNSQMSPNVSDPSSVPQVSAKNRGEGAEWDKISPSSIVRNDPKNMDCRLMGVLITTCPRVCLGVPKGYDHCVPACNSLYCAACIEPAGWVTHVALHCDPVWGSSKDSQQLSRHVLWQ